MVGPRAGKQVFVLQAVSAQAKRHAAAIYSPFGTEQRNWLNIEAYLRYLFERLPDPSINRTERLPWATVGQLSGLELAARAGVNVSRPDAYCYARMRSAFQE